MEKKILQATEYLLLALNQIKNFQDFINYKQELIKAINDIKDSVQIKNNGGDSNENKIISKISSNLGLKYDYNSIIPNTEERDDDTKIYRNEFKNIIKSYSKLNANKAFYSINQNENENEDIIRNNETILYNPDKVLNCTESLRSKLSRIKYDKLYATKKIRNRFRNKNRIKKYFEETRQKEKIDTIAEIIMKINKEKYIHDILIKLFGDNISDKLLYNKVSDDFINEVQAAIIEIEQLKNDSNRNKNENENEKENIIEKPNIIQQKKYQIPILKRSNTNKDLNINCYKSYEKKPMNLKPKRFQSNKFKYAEPYQEFDFKDSLRNKSPNGKNSNNSINNESDIKRKLRSSKNLMNSSIGISNNQKPFINATCGYGKYFDEPLQKGGVSKLE